MEAKMSKAKEAADLAQRVVQGTGVSQTTSATPAGQSNGDTEQPSSKDGMIEAINQVFALFRLNYHNQFYAAYPDNGQLNQIKRLWLESLNGFSADVILLGARHAIENSEYLPTLHRMLESCQDALRHKGLPGPREAFIEASQKPSPKQEQQWSHPAVYFAGRDSDWFFLANNTESKTWPVFKPHYERYVALVLRGEELAMPDVNLLSEQPEHTKMSTDERKAALNNLRAETGIYSKVDGD